MSNTPAIFSPFSEFRPFMQNCTPDFETTCNTLIIIAEWLRPRSKAAQHPDMTVYFQFPRSPELSRDARPCKLRSPLGSLRFWLGSLKKPMGLENGWRQTEGGRHEAHIHNAGRQFISCGHHFG